MKLILFAFLIVFFAACNQEQNTSPYKNNLHLSEAYLASLDTVNYTVIQWVDSAKNFGTITEGDSVKFDYKFKNAGNTPLFISNVQTSCGCTITQFPQNAIMPGQENHLTVTFNSEGHPGAVFKNVSIITNTKNKIKHFVEFSGTVLNKKNKQ